MEFGNLGHLKPLGGKNWWHLQGVQGGWGPLQSRSLCAAELSSAADTDSPSFFSLFLAASVSAPSCVVKLKRHLCGVPPGRSQASLPCPVRGSLSSWGLLSRWGPRLLGDGRCRPGEAFFLPSALSLQCFVLLRFLMWDPGLSQSCFCSWISVYLLIFSAGTDAGVSHLAILLMLLCRSQMHISFF